MPAAAKYKPGETVMAKWPGSSLWFPCTVISHEGQKIRVKFEDGSEDELAPKNVNSEVSFKRSQSKSPSRKKSPARPRQRSRSRGRSPGARKRTPSAKKRTPSQQRTRSRSPGTRRSATPPKRTRTPRSTAKVVSSSGSITHFYTTRSSTKAGKVLELPVEIKSTRVPKTTHYEFGGPIGALLMTVGLPLLVYYFYFACQPRSCSPTKIPWAQVKAWRQYLDLKSMGVVAAWFLFQVLLALIPVGKESQGMQLRNGHRLTYRCNGFLALSLSLLGVALLHRYTSYPLTFVYDHYLQLTTAAILLSFLFSVALYAMAKAAKKQAISPAGNSGNFIYDFFMGHELNPRLGSLDLKFFCELRPGMIGWVVLNVCMVIKQQQSEGGQASLPLLMLTAFQFLYVADSLWSEEAILTTFDMMEEGFGYMLCFGDLVWVPFTYTLQTRYLVDHPVAMPNYCLAAIALMKMVGFIIFRQANSQKNAFRRNPYNPRLAHLESMPTSTGKRLLVSGWWGLVRHPNYLGDIIMATSWGLTCGLTHLLPWYYPIFLTVLLVTRQRRDDAACHRKYGGAWDHYCQRVPYRIIPYLY